MLAAEQFRDSIFPQNLRCRLSGEYQDLLAIPVDVQLAAADNSCQFVVRLQRKPYLVVWPVVLEEFPLQARSHIVGVNLHLIPL